MLVALVFVAAFAAFVVSTVAGGGAGLVLAPLLRAVIPIETVPAALSIGTAASSTSRIAVFRRAIRWDVVRLFVPAALPAAALGAWLLTLFQPAYVELIIGLFLLANLPALFRRARSDGEARPLGLHRLPWIGAMAGLLSGFTGAVGLLFNNVYRRMGLSREEIVATRAMNEVLLHLLKIALYAWFGLLTAQALAAGLLVALAALLASVSMRWLLPLIHDGLFRRIGQAAMVAAGVAMFTLSSGEIARLHDAWVAHVAPDGEHELHLYWDGRQRIAAELESEGYPVIERTIAFAALPIEVQAAALRIAPQEAIHMVEEVFAPTGRSYEIYYRAGGRSMKAELG